MSSYIRVVDDGAVRTIRLARPEARNALSSAVAAQLAAAVREAGSCADIRVVVIAGDGPCFAAGADVRELESLDVARARQFIATLSSAMRAVREIPQPVIAAVHGHCLGAAVELVASADLAVAAADARFGMPEVAIGIPSVIEAALLVPVVGLARARELVLTAETIDAEEAWRIGLVNRVVPSDELEAEVRRLAERLLANSPAAMAQQKALIARWLATGNLDEAIRGSIDSFAVAFASGEPARRLAARRRR